MAGIPIHSFRICMTNKQTPLNITVHSNRKNPSFTSQLMGSKLVVVIYLRRIQSIFFCIKDDLARIGLNWKIDVGKKFKDSKKEDEKYINFDLMRHFPWAICIYLARTHVHMYICSVHSNIYIFLVMHVCMLEILNSGYSSVYVNIYKCVCRYMHLDMYFRRRAANDSNIAKILNFLFIFWSPLSPSSFSFSLRTFQIILYTVEIDFYCWEGFSCSFFVGYLHKVSKLSRESVPSCG